MKDKTHRIHLMKNFKPATGVWTFVPVMGLSLLTFSLSACGKTFTRYDLVYSRWTNPVEMEATEKMISRFEKQTGYKVKFIYADWGQYWEKLQTQLASNTGPDVFLLDPMYFHDFLKRGSLYDLTDKINPELLLNMWKKGTSVFRYRGRLYALPWNINVSFIYYNKDIFAAAGIHEPEPNWTLEDFIKTAQKLTVPGKRYGYAISNVMEICWGPWVWNFGGRIMDTETLTPHLTDPNTIKAFQFLVDLMTKYHAAPTPQRTASLGDFPFKTGQVAMVSDGSWMIPDYAQSCSFDWDITLFPKVVKQTTSINGVAHAINPKSKHIEVALKFIEFMNSYEAQELLAKTQTSIPINKEVFEKIYMKLDNPKINREIIRKAIEISRPLPITPKMSRWAEHIMGKYLDLMFMGEIPVKDALMNANEEISRLFHQSS